MKATGVLLDGFSRIADVVHTLAKGLTEAQLEYRPGTDANSIGWLIWHLSRVQDDHVAGVADTEQVWAADGWADKLGLDIDTGRIGYGDDSDEVAEIRGVSAAMLLGYFDAVHAATVKYLETLDDSDLDQVVDRRWDPPVTLSVRLVSVLSDDLQHAGQAAYVRGLLPGE